MLLYSLMYFLLINIFLIKQYVFCAVKLVERFSDKASYNIMLLSEDKENIVNYFTKLIQNNVFIK